MRFYAAPMEGITGYVFRNVHHQIFPGADRYYMPFLSPGDNSSLTTKEKKDIFPEHNQGISVVPQILTNRADRFLGTAEHLVSLGYDEVNLNLGCPSGTVTSKKKGAGFLSVPDRLDAFFDEVCNGMDARFPEIRFTVKTRLGVEDPEEFLRLIPVFNRYPIDELTIHPRVRSDFYKGLPRMEMFRKGLAELKMPVCFNGNIFSAEDAAAFRKEFADFSGAEAVMIGRGFIASPWIFTELAGQRLSSEETFQRFCRFHEALLRAYEETLPGDRSVLFKMKELWYYAGQHFPDSAKALKKVKKAQRVEEYRAAAGELLQQENFDKDVRLYFT